MKLPFAGGCLCSAVRYECSEGPSFTANCHCRDCQKSSGGAYVSVFGVSRDAVTVTGELREYTLTAESGNTFSRSFCVHCGTQLFGSSSGRPHMLMIKAGTLDDASWFSAAIDIFTESALPWAPLNPATPKFPRGPRARARE
jgi:hypothetical protein